MVTSGIALLVTGLFAALLGLGTFVNYSHECLVTPGFSPCIDRFQIALLAPLYPLSGALFMTGILTVALGFTFTFLGIRRLAASQSQTVISVRPESS